MELLVEFVRALEWDARFNTSGFLLLFLPIVVALHWVLPRGRPRWGMLVVASFAFYSMWDWRFSGLLLLGSAIDFIVVGRMMKSTRKKQWVAFSVVANLGLLGFFKYTGFFLENLESSLALLGWTGSMPAPQIVLPVGISFYTFQTMSYTLDAYRGDINEEHDFLKFLCFVSMFPQLVAGPIVRYSELSQQMDAVPRQAEWTTIWPGLQMFAIGLFKKTVIADWLARRSDPLWADVGSMTSPEAWTAAVGYSLQLYFDFSGYSQMAIGIGLMLALRFPTNFNAPYQATDPRDFWHRWHMTLSRFLRDYLFIPLGGSRGSRTRTLANLMIVMVLGGLWHGAAYTFVLWGAYHGALLIGYQLVRNPWDRLWLPVRRVAMFLLAMLGWVMFRAHSPQDAFTVMGKLAGAPPLNAAFVAILAILAAAMVLRPITVESLAKDTWPRRLWIAGTFALAIMAMTIGTSPFLYYQF